MATIEEIEARAANMRAMELAALCALADAMRELAVQLPEGSRLAVDFATQARKLDRDASLDRDPNGPFMGGTTMMTFVTRALRDYAPIDAGG